MHKKMQNLTVLTDTG